MKLEVSTGWYFLFLFTFVKVITKLKDFVVTENGTNDSTHCQNCILQSKNKFQNKQMHFPTL